MVTFQEQMFILLKLHRFKVLIYGSQSPRTTSAGMQEEGFTKRVVLPRRTDANHGDAETRSVVLGQFLEESGDSAEERAKDLRPSR